MDHAQLLNQRFQISRTEQRLLLLPLAASAFVGLFQLLLPTLLAKLTGYTGNDLYIYQLSGAATFGYTVALALALRQRYWTHLRLVVTAFFTFGIASLYACGADILGGQAKPVVYVVLVLTLVFVSITGTLLYIHRGIKEGNADTANWLKWFLVIATVLATTFGLLPLLFPDAFHQLFALKGSDVFIFRQAGAATLGYAVMGICELRSRNWQEMRWPLVMAGTFNGLSFLASLLVFVTHGPLVLALLIAPASLGVTIATIVAVRNQGK